MALPTVELRLRVNFCCPILFGGVLVGGDGRKNVELDDSYELVVLSDDSTRS